jgi:hypothetical protein
MLHDFNHSQEDKSKFYLEPNLKEIKLLRKHHEKFQDPNITPFQKYDRIGASINRKIRSSQLLNIDTERLFLGVQVIKVQVKTESHNLWDILKGIFLCENRLNSSLLEVFYSYLTFHLLWQD